MGAPNWGHVQGILQQCLTSLHGSTSAGTCTTWLQQYARHFLWHSAFGDEEDSDLWCDSEMRFLAARHRCLLSPHFPSDTIAEPRINFWQNQEAPNMPRLSLAYPGGMPEYQLSMAPEDLEIAGYPLRFGMKSSKRVTEGHLC